MNGSSFDRAGGRLCRYPGGTENATIFVTDRGSILNRRAACDFGYSHSPAARYKGCSIRRSQIPPPRSRFRLMKSPSFSCNLLC